MGDVQQAAAARADVSDSAGASSSAKWPAYFFPPLAQQRWVYCLDVLKREDIKSVCELGCGEGAVLAPMTNPASHIDSFPDVYIDEPFDLSASAASGDDEDGTCHAVQPSDINVQVLDKYKALPKLRAQDKQLHLRRIAGLDVVPELLQQAVKATAPPPPSKAPAADDPFDFSYESPERWEELRVELWQGSLDVYNDAFDNFEAFILTEVIEHLQDKALHKFPNILFGSYRPRIVVVTTPNYDFNQYFRRKHGSEDGEDDDHEEAETKNEFKDPTGRTERVFRDADHKFEWTQSEFKDWCDHITKTYDYTVDYEGVGSLKNYFGKGGMRLLEEDDSTKQMPQRIQELLAAVPGGDPSQFFATQIAIFRRKFAYESERNPRSPAQAPLAFYGTGKKSASKSPSGSDAKASGTSTQSPDSSPAPLTHKLLKAHHYKPVSEAGNPRPLSEIRAVLDDLMRNRMRYARCSLRELWGRKELPRVCGGYINKVIEALVVDPQQTFDLEFKSEMLESGAQMEDATFIILKGFEEPEIHWPNDDEEEEEEEGDDDGASQPGSIVERIKEMQMDELDEAEASEQTEQWVKATSPIDTNDNVVEVAAAAVSEDDPWRGWGQSGQRVESVWTTEDTEMAKQTPDSSGW